MVPDNHIWQKTIYGLSFIAVCNDVDGVAQFSGKRVTYGEE
jgi:hypothetical protein